MPNPNCGPDPESDPKKAEILEREIYLLIDEDIDRAYLRACEEEEDER